MKETKAKKQFRLYDIYRYMAQEEASSIHGIETYKVERQQTVTVIVITFDTGFIATHYCASEADLKDAVRWINKHLGNCGIPGPKHSKGKQIRFKI